MTTDAQSRRRYPASLSHNPSGPSRPARPQQPSRGPQRPASRPQTSVDDEVPSPPELPPLPAQSSTEPPELASLENLLRQAGYKETRVFTPEAERVRPRLKQFDDEGTAELADLYRSMGLNPDAGQHVRHLTQAAMPMRTSSSVLRSIALQDATVVVNETVQSPPDIAAGQDSWWGSGFLSRAAQTVGKSVSAMSPPATVSPRSDVGLGLALGGNGVRKTKSNVELRRSSPSQEQIPLPCELVQGENTAAPSRQVVSTCGFDRPVPPSIAALFSPPDESTPALPQQPAFDDETFGYSPPEQSSVYDESEDLFAYGLGGDDDDDSYDMDEEEYYYDDDDDNDDDDGDDHDNENDDNDDDDSRSYDSSSTFAGSPPARSFSGSPPLLDASAVLAELGLNDELAEAIDVASVGESVSVGQRILASTVEYDEDHDIDTPPSPSSPTMSPPREVPSFNIQESTPSPPSLSKFSFPVVTPAPPPVPTFSFQDPTPSPPAVPRFNFQEATPSPPTVPSFNFQEATPSPPSVPAISAHDITPPPPPVPAINFEDPTPPRVLTPRVVSVPEPVTPTPKRAAKTDSIADSIAQAKADPLPTLRTVKPQQRTSVLRTAQSTPALRSAARRPHFRVTPALVAAPALETVAPVLCDSVNSEAEDLPLFPLAPVPEPSAGPSNFGTLTLRAKKSLSALRSYWASAEKAEEPPVDDEMPRDTATPILTPRIDWAAQGFQFAGWNQEPQEKGSRKSTDSIGTMAELGDPFDNHDVMIDYTKSFFYKPPTPPRPAGAATGEGFGFGQMKKQRSVKSLRAALEIPVAPVPPVPSKYRSSARHQRSSADGSRTPPRRSPPIEAPAIRIHSPGAWEEGRPPRDLVLDGQEWDGHDYVPNWGKGVRRGKGKSRVGSKRTRKTIPFDDDDDYFY
ncbi:uncharacterized protein EHS24_006389 [Apiotrichum porosum]|uniref:Uncharacterized protein n=1 Tax=Apiotrichum porosum TaxID=105984 RepID=A0A427Y199_9TREE|nr:uncharacterized protein EHS24_006389 [Apiotrichum porosum]RSH84857.1 hypothetical protein EHS24_006389 [Apiotrichum porosum]